MSVSTVTLKYLLLGEDKTASSAMKKLSGQSEETGSTVHRMSTKSKVALLAIGGAAVAFGNSSINKFKQVGAETMGLQRTLGGTVQDASRLRFAAEQTGTSYETLSKSTGKLSK